MVGMVKVSGDLDWETCSNVRHWVFCVEKKVPASLQTDQWDTRDGSAEHFLICDMGLPYGAFRCHPQGDAVPLQWLCVLRQFRRKGLGRAALEYACNYYRKKGLRKLVVAPEFNSAIFFQRCSFHSVSEFIMEIDL